MSMEGIDPGLVAVQPLETPAEPTPPQEPLVPVVPEEPADGATQPVQPKSEQEALLEFYKQNQANIDRIVQIAETRKQELAQQQAEQARAEKEAAELRKRAEHDGRARLEMKIEDDLRRMFPNRQVAPEAIDTTKYVIGTAVELAQQVVDQKLMQREVATLQENIDRSREEFFHQNPEFVKYRAEMEYLVDHEKWPAPAAVLQLEKLHPELVKPPPSQVNRPRDPRRGTFIETPAGGNAAPPENERDTAWKRLSAQLDKADDVESMYASLRSTRWK